MPRKIESIDQNPKYLRLVEAYLDPEQADFNQREAARIAGFNDVDNAYRLFKHPVVKKYMEEVREGLAERHGITKERLMLEAGALAFSSLGDLIKVDEVTGAADYDFTKMTRAQRKAVQSFQTEVYQEGRGETARDVKRTKMTFHSKLQAMEFLAKVLGILKEEVNVSGELSLVERLQAGRKRAAARKEEVTQGE